MGVAAWQLVLSDLSNSTHVFAKDWLGCGQSSRPKWEAKGVEETEAFFVESLEKCVKKVGEGGWGVMCVPFVSLGSLNIFSRMKSVWRVHHV